MDDIRSTESAGAVYEIRIRDRLDEDWSEWFGSMTLTHNREGQTILTGPVADQAALHGLLSRISDLNLTLISVIQLHERETANLTKARRSMKNKILWLRISYWAGALGDFALAVLALSPEMMEVPAYCYPMGLFAAVAFSWGVMLLLADREPVQRRWVLLPTILVGSLLLIAVIYAMYAGVLPLAGSRLLNLILYPAMIALWSFSYINSRELD